MTVFESLLDLVHGPRLSFEEAAAVAREARERVEDWAVLVTSKVARERISLVASRIAELERRPVRNKVLLAGQLLELQRDGVAAVAEEHGAIERRQR